MTTCDDPARFPEAIRQSGLTIYDLVQIGDPDLWIPTLDLEELLNAGLVGISLEELPLRTRSKVVKEYVCRALGYPVPTSFKKTQPRFPGQDFDTYVQKANNLQVWNEDLSPTRRYVLIRVSEADLVTKVRVVTGKILARLDTTGTLTQKYQARLVLRSLQSELVADEDTWLLRPLVLRNVDLGSIASPINPPRPGQLLSIGEIFERLQALIGITFPDAGYDQERRRGSSLHRLVCHYLGYTSYKDYGRFPDVRHQLLEVKLQTSPTIDLGLVRPDSEVALGVPHIDGRQIRHCDVRYAVFYAKTDGKHVTLTHLFLTTGERFFSRFPQFQGKVLSEKLQIPLPADFFED